MKDKIEIVDSWEKMTLKQFSELSRLQARVDEEGNKIPLRTADLIKVLSNLNEDDIESLPMSIIDIIISKLEFLQTPPTYTNTNSIIINGEKFRINYEEELKFGEWVDTQTVIDADKFNHSAILAIICRKKDEVYDNKFSQEILPKRIEMFEQQPLDKILPLIGFFLNLLYMSSNITSTSIDHLKEEARELASNLESFLRDGDGKKSFSIWQKIKLIRLKKSIENI